jgi:hypothetical protein
MISDFEILHQPVPDFTSHIACLDRLISVGSTAYNPETNTINGSFINDGVGLFIIHSSVFCQYFTITKSPYPMFPTLNRGIANNVSRYVYDGIKELYLMCKSMVKIDYNTVNFNLARTSVYKHTHKFASPNDTSIDTQVFQFKLTNLGPRNSTFKLYSSEYVELPMTDNCTFRFNGMLEHEVASAEDPNYYGYFVFEKWPE